ncbi:hypothetical protein PTSG_05557 [Salpingoeca rosetta]|uniref:tRNA synthetases class I catalytic domain-containing protein n=1 Tax=Salpingoeca rosetta (strain ATCC 50818 / BSB-021) TaxID=946362 RepID=F2UBJ6_SALR5|nr:uncharacterized protein PTSG_05557 [Salpingoeca rosetta]EGD73862.1 hypothetical protein PTSG_05557 [Salpingoeca rosetta]|eukprot:XP_004993425.1 hypothetical protein PTSG_05557 [Salpingoeca rosetta]
MSDGAEGSAAKQQQVEEAWRWSPPPGSDASLKLTDVYTDEEVTLERSWSTITFLVQPITATKAAPSVRLLRTLISADTTRRVLQSSFGFNVLFALCVDDLGVDAETARAFEEELVKALKAANILPPSLMLRASDYIEEAKTTMDTLLKNAHAYEADGEIMLGSDTNPALWVKGSGDAQTFDASWGKGRPTATGIAMALTAGALDAPLDIVFGGEGTANVSSVEALNAALKSASAVTAAPVISTPVCLQAKATTMDADAVGVGNDDATTVAEAATSPRLRLAVLRQSVFDDVALNAEALKDITHIEQQITAFLAAMSEQTSVYTQDRFEVLTQHDQDLMLNFFQLRQEIHKSLCNNINTAAVLDHLLAIIATVAAYTTAQAAATKPLHVASLRQIGLFVTGLLVRLGVSFDMHAATIGFAVAAVATPEEIAARRKEFSQVFAKFFEQLSSGPDADAYKSIIDQARAEGIF